MAETIPNLWPKEFKVDVQSPLAILRVQAALLGKVTRGILEGSVETETSKEMVQHRLVVVAPAYNGYRHTLLVARHDPNLPYPVELIAEALAEKVQNTGAFVLSMGPTFKTVYPRANNDDEMTGFVGKALNSGPTMAAILSLISKSNEAKLAPLPVAESAAPGSEVER